MQWEIQNIHKYFLQILLSTFPFNHIKKSSLLFKISCLNSTKESQFEMKCEDLDIIMMINRLKWII